MLQEALDRESPHAGDRALEVVEASPRRRLIVEFVGVMAAVFLITLGYVGLRPLVVSSGIIPLIILFELGLYVVLVALVAVVNAFNHRGFSSGLGFRGHPVRRQILIGLAIFALTISFIVVPLLLGANRADVLNFKPRNLLILLYQIVHSFLFVGFGEELVWRGYFVDRAKEITGSAVWAIILPALFFGVWHYPNGQNVAQIFVTAAMGMLYGFARLKLRDCSTLATGLAHGLHDSTIVVLSYFLL